MYNISHKYKHFLFLLLKLVLVVSAFYFIHQKLVSNELLSFSELKTQLVHLFSKNFWVLIVVLLFTDANWLLEIYKWKLLASIEQKITFFEAYKQSLASLTASILTPNRIGEYGIKAFYFEKKLRKKIVLLNFLGNMSQLAITSVFGLVGFLFFYWHFSIEIPAINFNKVLFVTVFIVGVFFSIQKFNFFKKGIGYWNKIYSYLKKIPVNSYFKILGLALLRYLVFSHQFYFLLRLFEVETPYFTLINLLFCVYFIASIIPTLTIFDWVIKGSVAVFVFSFIGLNELTIVTITTIMWLLNFAFPAVLGSVFVLNFKLTKTL